MKRQHTTLTVLLLLGYCVCSYAAADDRLHPQTKFASHGISLVSPDEDGWVVFNPTGKDPSLAKYGATRIETYSIQISYSKSPSSLRACEREFADIAKRINTTVSDRFKVRVNRTDLDLSRGPYFVNYYTLAIVWASMLAFGCATSPDWTGVKIRSVSGTGKYRLLVPEYEWNQLAHVMPQKSATDKQGFIEGARRIASDAFKMRGICPNGFRGPDIVNGSTNPPVLYFDVECF